jgi:hypothetical protein
VSGKMKLAARRKIMIKKFGMKINRLKCKFLWQNVKKRKNVHDEGDEGKAGMETKKNHKLKVKERVGESTLDIGDENKIIIFKYAEKKVRICCSFP